MNPFETQIDHPEACSCWHGPLEPATKQTRRRNSDRGAASTAQMSRALLRHAGSFLSSSFGDPALGLEAGGRASGFQTFKLWALEGGLTNSRLLAKIWGTESSREEKKKPLLHRAQMSCSRTLNKGKKNLHVYASGIQSLGSNSLRRPLFKTLEHLCAST